MSVTSVPIRVRVLPALQPVNGQSVEMRATDDFIQWKMTGATDWIDLIAIADITGPIGPSTEYRNNGSYIQYRPVSDDPDADWFDLVAISDITGPPPNFGAITVTMLPPGSPASGNATESAANVWDIAFSLPGATVPDKSIGSTKVSDEFIHSSVPFGRSGAKIVRGERFDAHHGWGGIMAFASGKWVNIYRKASSL